MENDANDRHTMREAIVTARFLHIFHKYSEQVRLACYSPVVNVRGAIYVHRGGIVLRPEYHVFNVFASRCNGVVLHTEVEVPTYDTRVKKRDEPDKMVQIDNVPYLDCSATLDERAGKICLSLVNLHEEQEIEAEVRLQGIDTLKEAEAHELNGSSVETFNDIAHPNEVTVVSRGFSPHGTTFSYLCPAHSITFLVMSV